MAIRGSVSTTTNLGRSVTLNWTATQNIADNTSLVVWSLVGSGNAVGPVDVSRLHVTINGRRVYYRDAEHTECIAGTLLTSGSISISHDVDGTKSFDISIGAGISSQNINCTGSGTFTLSAIPRAAIIQSAEDITLGNNCSISWVPTSIAFRYKIRFAMGSYSLTTNYINVSNTSLYTYRMTNIAESAATSIPNSRTGTMVAYLYTYSGDKQIGSVSSATFTVTVPSNAGPTLSAIGVTYISDNPVINGWNAAVAGYSKVRLTAPAYATYGSTISGFSIVSDSYIYSQDGVELDYTSNILKRSGSTDFVINAIDSRGMRSQYQKATITVWKYIKPTIESFSVSRDNQNHQKILLNTKWSYSSIGERNILDIVLYYKRNSDSSWSRYDGAITSNSTITLSGNFDESSSYAFMISITDSLGNSAQAEGVVSTIGVLVDFKAGGRGLAIGKIAESDGFEVALDSTFSGNVYIKVENTNVPLMTYIKNVINGVYD